MTVPTISNLPTVPATSDPNFETEAPALFNHIKNTFVSEMNSAISFINSSTFDATVEFKNASFTAAKNFLYMIDTTGGAVTVTLPASPATGDQLLLMDQKRYFATNNLTIGRNGKNINGAASNVVSKSTGALIRCVYNSNYGWTVDLYEGQWESGTSAGDLVYNGGKVGIGTSSPGYQLEVDSEVHGQISVQGETTAQLLLGNESGPEKGRLIYRHSNDSFAIDVNSVERMTIDSSGKVGIGTSSPDFEFHVKKDQNATTTLALHNLNAGTSANAQFYVETDHLAGDPLIQFKVKGVQAFMVGIDNSDGDKFKISDSGHSLGTNDRLVIDSSGNVEVSTGNLVIGTAGKGIDFSANSHFGGTGGGTGMSSELLNSYEEGTFTPTYEPNSGSFTSITHYRQTGNYTKIGNTVHCWIDISTNELTVGTASGGIYISGLPFTIAANSNAIVGAQSGWITNAPDHAAVQSGQTKISLRWLDQSTQNYQTITTSNIKTGTNTDANRLMGISFSYKTS